MHSNPIDRNALIKAGLAALERGDAPGARGYFESIVAAGAADAPVSIALALACQRMDDAAAVLKAVDLALAFDPRNIDALLMKGDCLVTQGNARAATQFYTAAVAQAAMVKNLPARLAESVRLAAAARDRINAHIEAHLRRQLAAAGYSENASSARFTQSLDLMTGRKQRYIQQPRAYFFPDLPQLQFYPLEMFPWLGSLEAATDDIVTEAAEVLQTDRGFEPYIQAHSDTPLGDDHKLLGSLDWSAFFLYKDGAVLQENAARCPKTMTALEQLPMARIKGRGPMALFSVLKPGARIAPHHGFLNSRLICHLPLIVPPGCCLRVGNERREWQKGRAWVFDDTIEHEAWNSSDQTRVVLIFDIWRPELTPEERELVSALMEAVDSYTGPRVEWTA